MTNCQFSEPVKISDKPATWVYSKMTCDTDLKFLVEHPESAAGNFEIQKTYTYGDITTILVLGFIALFLVFYVIKKTFTHSEVKIHGTPTIKF